jgi:hypothetical protein
MHNDFEIDFERNFTELDVDENKIKILSLYSNKKIFIICNKCKTSILRTISSISSGCGCGVCSNSICIKGINDINTTHPHLIKYFCNIEDSYNYTFGSHAKVQMNCPYCNNIKTYSVSRLTDNGFSCELCNDKISYPEKFMSNFLSQLKVEFITQYKPYWCNYLLDNKLRQGRYDFYLPHYNLIIETDGGQHYNSSFLDLESQVNIDKQKDMFALTNNIKIIRVDCRFSNMDYIKNNILKSELSEMFILNEIKWNECAIKAETNLFLKVCDMYNSGIKETKILAEKFGLDRTTITIWLNRADKLNICRYNGFEHQRKKVINLITKVIYDGINIAVKETNTPRSSIITSCKTGKPIKGVIWSYVS